MEYLLNGHLTPEDRQRVEDLAAEMEEAAQAIHNACHTFNKNWSELAERCGLWDATRKYNELAEEANKLANERRVLTIGGLPYEFEQVELMEPDLRWANDEENRGDFAESTTETVELEDGETIEEFRGEKVAAA